MLATLLQKGRRVFWIILTLYGLWALMIVVAQERLIFPTALVKPRPAPAPPQTEILQLEAADGTLLEAWLLHPEDTAPDTPLPAVVYLHGNAECIDWCAQYSEIRDYLRQGFRVLLPEFRGYVRMGSSPSQQALVSDMVQWHDWLAQRPDIDPRRIVFHGRSLGGGIAAALAAERPPAALILESTFTSMVAMGHRYLLPDFLCRHPFRTDLTVPDLHCPVLILHGTRDLIVPVRHGRRLHELVPGSTYVELPAGHNDMSEQVPAHSEALRGFLRKNGLSPVL